jgi:DNA-binding NtrC family response regulator
VSAIERRDDNRTAAWIVARAAAARGVEAIRLAARLEGRLLDGIASRCAHEGFSVVRASVDPTLAWPHLRAGRQVVLVWAGRTEQAAALRWVQALSSGAGPCRHLVVEIARGRPSPEDWDVKTRERQVARDAPATGWSANEPGAESWSRRLDRAERFARRGRRASAERWARSALASAMRTGQGKGRREAFDSLARHALRRSGPAAAAQRLAGWIDAHGPAEERAEAIALVAELSIEAGNLDRAETLLSGLEAEARIRDVECPVGVRCAQAALRFWQGRFAEAGETLAPAPPADPKVASWRALVAWAVGDRAALERATSGAAWRAGDRAGTALRLALVAVLSPTAPNVTAARTARCGGDPDVRCTPPGWVVDALVAESETMLGRRVLEGAEPERSPDPRPGRTGRLARGVLGLIRARAAQDGLRIREAVRELRGLGALGALRWGLGREGMNLLHAIPALLHLVHDAEDEHGALVRGCQWIRRHAGADAAAVVTDSGGRIVAADGWSRGEEPDLADICVESGRRAVVGPSGAMVGAPVRYHGLTIGTVVARTATARIETAHEAVTTLASLCAPALRARLDAIVARAAREQIMPELVGGSPKIESVRDAVARAAGTMFPVLVEGESGTGKELVARALHRLSARRDRRFAAVNCAALADDLVEAELFGYVRGAFTGAIGPRVGLFEEASGGTLFLDEVGELSLRAQAKLLRAVQEREIRRLGENAPRAVDVRIVAATNRSLPETAALGQFREDLLFRLSVVRIQLPPLRERIEDVPRLAQIFWRSVMSETGKHAAIGADVLAGLCRHNWPGNVRELQNVMAGLSVQAPARGRVTVRHLAQVLSTVQNRPAAIGVSLERARWLFERETVAAALARHGGRRSSAARELGLTRQGLVKAIRRLGLADGVGRAGVA